MGDLRVRITLLDRISLNDIFDEWYHQRMDGYSCGRNLGRKELWSNSD